LRTPAISSLWSVLMKQQGPSLDFWQRTTLS